LGPEKIIKVVDNRYENKEIKNEITILFFIGSFNKLNNIISFAVDDKQFF